MPCILENRTIFCFPPSPLQRNRRHTTSTTYIRYISPHCILCYTPEKVANLRETHKTQAQRIIVLLAAHPTPNRRAMNFHISNLSPLRPQFSSSSLGGAPSRSHPSPRLSSHQEATNHQNDSTSSSGPVRIAVEPAADDALSSSNPGTDVDDDDDDDDTDSLSDGSADVDDVTQDSRDVLVQRLTDLAERIGSAESVRTSCIEALHKEVDEMERVLRGSNSHRDRSTSRHSHASTSRRKRGALQPVHDASSSRPRSLQLPTGQSSSSDSARGRESLGIMPPMSPSWLMSQFQRRPSVHQEEAERPLRGQNEKAQDSEVGEEHVNSSSALPLTAQDPKVQQSQRPAIERVASLDSSTSSAAPRISSQVAEDAIKEAEKLCAEMATVIESLQTRRQESDVMPSL